MSAEKYVIRTNSLRNEDFTRIRHPKSPDCDVRMIRLADQVGLHRAPLHLARVPAGRSSFPAHAHSVTEEFVFILSGEGRVVIDGEDIAVGAGDFVGFPTDGTAHTLHNNSPDTDLLYLMGGERAQHEISHFPGLGQIGVWDGSTMRFIDQDAGETFTIEDFITPADDSGR